MSMSKGKSMPAKPKGSAGPKMKLENVSSKGGAMPRMKFANEKGGPSGHMSGKMC
jgi:hypothetical protein